MDVDHVGLAALLVEEAARNNDYVTDFHKPCTGARRRDRLNHPRRVIDQLYHQSLDPPDERHRVHHGLVVAHRYDLLLGPVAGHQLRGVARARHGDDGLGLQVRGDLARGVTDGVRGAAVLPRRALLQHAGAIDRLLRPVRDPGHRLDGLDREVPDRRLRREHHPVRPVEYRVRHVAGLGPGGARLVHHGLEHLRGGDPWQSRSKRLLYQLLLDERDFLGRQLDAQVAARDHDALSNFQDLFDVGNALALFYLRHHRDVEAALVDGVDDLQHVAGGALERLGDPVDPSLEHSLQVAPVALGEARQLEAGIGEVHALALQEEATVRDLANYVRAVHFPHHASDYPVANDTP